MRTAVVRVTDGTIINLNTVLWIQKQKSDKGWKVVICWNIADGEKKFVFTRTTEVEADQIMNQVVSASNEVSLTEVLG